MECLGENERIRKNIATAPAKVIQAFHKLVFGEAGDRKNRNRLRSFSGFTFQDGGSDYHGKVALIQETFTERDLIAICNILCLDYGGLKEDIAKRICKSLMDFHILCQNDDDSDDDGDDDEDASSKSDYVPANGMGNENTGGVNEVGNVGFHARRNELPVIQQEREAARRRDFALTFRDVEGSIRNFDGSDAYPVERWIADFEDTTTLFGWTEMQQLIFARIRTVVPGSYYYFELLHPVKKILTSIKDNISYIEIAVNIDGLPLSKSSLQQFWPILGSVIPYSNIFVIGIYYGYEKPSDSNDHRAVSNISECLVTQLKCYVPTEFARKPRKLDCVKLWKATEYKLILLYTSPLAYKSVLKKDIYYHFLTLHVIVRILSSEELHEYLAYVQDLILFFVKTFIKLYGIENVSHNVHSLIHLVDDVKKFGSLDNFSAFKFENCMQVLKNYDTYIVHTYSDLKSWPLQNVTKKYVRLPYENENYTVFSLIHGKL
ncbi:hypothetical protein ALC57_16823 [Trachymyrmex cornetzi]|uniref:DUF4218 domain-containing protein n=1 Tax=Trachymyrmex cornetzi TaxID=471704 RepID=A0A151IUD9_9HYME|nr:hypothetical protein ALC57_16823 [Trachymyrmex cornetzi]